MQCKYHHSLAMEIPALYESYVEKSKYLDPVSTAFGRIFFSFLNSIRTDLHPIQTWHDATQRVQQDKFDTLFTCWCNSSPIQLCFFFLKPQETAAFGWYGGSTVPADFYCSWKISHIKSFRFLCERANGKAKPTFASEL